MLLAVTAAGIPFGNKASAATFKPLVRLDSLIAGATSSTGRVCLVSDQTATAIKSVRITFPFTNATTDYTLSATLTNWTTNTSNLDTQPAAQSALTGLATATASVVAAGAHQVTFDDAAGFTPADTTTNYCFNWAGSGLTNPTAWTGTETTPGKIEVFNAVAAGGALISSGTFSEPKTVTTFGTNVSVSATVPPSFQYTLGATSDPFGTTNISALNYTAGVTGTVITNAASGWVIWARSSANSGACAKACLHSTQKAYDILSSAATGSAAAVITNAAEHYDFQVSAVSLNAGTGTCSAITPATYFNGTVTATQGGPLDKTIMYPIASCNGSSSNGTVVFKEIVVPTAATPAATDYTDTIFTTAAGQF